MRAILGILFIGLSGCGPSPVPNNCAWVEIITGCDLNGVCGVLLSNHETTVMKHPAMYQKVCIGDK